MYKGVSANVDFYSGFAYRMLGIPEELFTPLFAIARISGYVRYQLLIKLLRTRRLPSAVRTVYDFHSAHSDVCAEVQLELNPQDMY